MAVYAPCQEVGLLIRGVLYQLSVSHRTLTIRLTAEGGLMTRVVNILNGKIGGPMNSESAVLSGIRSLPIRARVAFALGTAETVVGELGEDPEGLAMARESLRRSWQWVSGAKASASHVAEYIDGPEERNLGLREGYYSYKRSMTAALYATHLAVAYAASKAHDLEGLRKSEVVCEVDEDTLADILKHAKEAPGYSELTVHRLSGFLIEKYQGQSADARGDPPNQDEVLRQVAAVGH
jgi:hypothetical protein